MTSKKKNPNLCTTHESLTKGEGSLYRISGLFKGKARVCWVYHVEKDVYGATTAACQVDNEKTEYFKIKNAKSGKINIMCIERGE